VPAIVIALLIVTWYNQKNDAGGKENITISKTVKHIVLSKSVVLLLGAMVVGYITRPKGMASVEVFYKGIFMGF